MQSECRAKITVIGRVQGVGFRYSTLQMAKKLKLSGYVKNLPDHTLYIEAQGTEDCVRELINWCGKGPSGALIQSVDFSFHPVKDFKIFKIL